MGMLELLRALSRPGRGPAGSSVWAEELGALLRTGTRLVEEAVRPIPVGPRPVESLSYEEVMGWFSRQKSADPRVAKGALLRSPAASQGWTVTQVLLDAEGELVLLSDGAPLGRRIEARELDTELRDLFGDDTLVVVE